MNTLLKSVLLGSALLFGTMDVAYTRGGGHHGGGHHGVYHHGGYHHGGYHRGGWNRGYHGATWNRGWRGGGWGWGGAAVVGYPYGGGCWVGGHYNRYGYWIPRHPC